MLNVRFKFLKTYLLVILLVSDLLGNWQEFIIARVWKIRVVLLVGLLILFGGSLLLPVTNEGLSCVGVLVHI